MAISKTKGIMSFTKTKIQNDMPSFIKQIYKNNIQSLGKTIFLDRDGVLIEKVDYLSDPKQIKILPGVIEGIKKLNLVNALLIIITNQPVIARGLATIKKVQLIHNTLISTLNSYDAQINAVYFCPHHPEKNHPDIPSHALKYRIECDCRKPRLAMFKQAIKDFNINLKSSYIIGDSTRDIKAGDDLGLSTILVKTGLGGADNTYSIKPKYIAADFNESVEVICKQ